MARRLGEAAWRVLVAEQKCSGLSVARFCAREGVSTARFYQWRTRLGRDGGQGPSDAVPVRGEEAVPGFVDLGALGPGTPSGGGRFELRLELGGGLVLQLVRG